MSTPESRFEQFRDVTQFLLLPIPIECYFCSMPPSRDVIFVTLRKGEKVDIYNEPVLLRGTINLHQGSHVKFFYTLDETIDRDKIEASLSAGLLTVRLSLREEEKPRRIEVKAG